MIKLLSTLVLTVIVLVASATTLVSTNIKPKK